MPLAIKPPHDSATRAYERLRKLIVRGRLAPGTRLIETEVAQRLGLSRTPVRSALQRLMQEGCISNSEGGRQRRPFVAPLTREDARELLWIVGELEGLAAWRAAQLADSAALVEELGRINDGLLAEARNPRPSRVRVFRLDTTFHRQIVLGGAGPRLLALHDSIKPQAERYTRIYISAVLFQIDVLVEEHNRIVDAIAAGRADDVQDAVRANWRNAAERLGRAIEQDGEMGSW